MNTHHYSCAETAQFLRQALKRAFPGTRFSVRSKVYSGGASINISWWDGPTTAMVDNIVQPYAAGRFDGMIDMAYSVSHWLLPDGSLRIASNPGTLGQKGCNPPEHNDRPHPDAIKVRFGANYIFTDRHYSERFIKHACGRLARNGHPEFAEAAIRPVGPYSGAWIRDDAGNLDMSDLLRRECVRLLVA